MAAPAAYPMPPPMQNEPPEVQSIKSMLHIARILALIFGILILLGGIAYLAVVAYYYSVCSTLAVDAYCGSAFTGALVGAIWLVVGGVVAFLVWTQMKSIEAKVDAHQYEAAKSQTLIWMILGFIFGIILGIILLIAYIKFDPVISWWRQVQQGGAPAYGAAPAATMYAAPPPGAAPAPPPPAAPAAPLCPKCGRPTTYIAQYGRYYCYNDNLYV